MEAEDTCACTPPRRAGPDHQCGTDAVAEGGIPGARGAPFLVGGQGAVAGGEGPGDLTPEGRLTAPVSRTARLRQRRAGSGLNAGSAAPRRSGWEPSKGTRWPGRPGVWGNWPDHRRAGERRRVGSGQGEAKERIIHRSCSASRRAQAANRRGRL